MKARLFFLMSFLAVVFSTTVKAQIVIHASADDITITNTNSVWGWVGQTTARLNSSADQCYVIPFQLPTIPAGESITDVSFSYNVISYSNQPTATNIDFYGLNYSSTSSVDLINDYFVGTLDSGSTLLQDNILVGNLSEVGTQSTNASTNLNLVNYIDAQYLAGAVAGDYIFLRFSADASGNAETWNLDSENGINTSLHPILTITTAAVGPVAPVLASVGNITVEEEEVLNVTVNTTDANGDALTITASNVPGFVSFTDNGDGTGTININPLIGDEGTYTNIIIQVSDGSLTDSETISITVTKLATLIEIVAPPETGFVSDPAVVIDGDLFDTSGVGSGPWEVIKNPEINDEMKIGKSDVVGEPNLTNAILPFQLPARPSGKTVVDAQLSVFVSFGRQWTNATIDLYGLPYQSTNTIYSADYYSGTYGDNQNGRNAVGLEENILVKSNPLSMYDTQRWVSTTNNTAIATFIDDQYDAGAVAGDWVFFRFSVNNAVVIGYHYFVIDGGDGQGYNVDGSYNSTPKPSVLKMDFYNSLDTTTTWNGSNWSNGDPDNRLDAIVDANITIVGASSLQAKDLIVQNNATITVNQGANLVIHNSLVVDSGSKIDIQSGGSFVTTNDAATVIVNGDFWVERTSRATLSNYSYWSSPVNTTIQTALINSGSPIVYRFDTPTHNDANNDGQDDGFAAWISENGAMNSGQGYAAYGSDNGVTASSHNVIFKAGEGSGVKNVNAGTVNINTYISNHTANPNVDDWNLLGNPYSTSIFGRTFMQQNSSVGTLYFWTHTYPLSGNYYSVNDYATYNLSGGVGVGAGVIPDGKIASGQAFFTDVDVAGTVTFNSSMQIENVYDTWNNNFYRSANESTNVIENPFIEDRLWIDVYDDNSFNQILIAFTDKASNEFDHQYDGLSRELGNNLRFYSISNRKNLSIQGRSSFKGDEVIPLGIKVATRGEKTFKMKLSKSQGLLKPDNTTVFLLDNLTGFTHNLSETEYEFTVENGGEYNDRFVMYFEKKQQTNENKVVIDREIYMYPNPVVDEFRIVSFQQKIKELSIYNLQGGLVKKYNVSATNKYSVNELASGIYILKIREEDDQIITHKILKL